MHREIIHREITIVNKRGQNLEGVLHDAGSTNIIITCNPYKCNKDHFVIMKVAGALESAGVSLFRFDHSEPEYITDPLHSANYDSEIEDLRAVFEYFSGINRLPAAVLGVSKGANVVLEYGSKYHDIGCVINISGRYDPWHVDNKTSKDRSDTNGQDAWLTIDPSCKVLTCHGNADIDVTLEEAYEIGKGIADHRLEIIDGADHKYVGRLDELAAAVVRFAKDTLQL